MYILTEGPLYIEIKENCLNDIIVTFSVSYITSSHPDITPNSVKKKPKQNSIGCVLTTQIYKKLHLGPCTKIQGIRELKRVMLYTNQTDKQQKHLYSTTVHIVPWLLTDLTLKYWYRDIRTETQQFKDILVCISTAAPVAGAEHVSESAFNLLALPLQTALPGQSRSLWRLYTLLKGRMTTWVHKPC